MLNVGVVSPTGSLLCSLLCEEEEERLLDEARAQLARGAALLVDGTDDDLPPALELFDDAVAKAPALRAHAVSFPGRPPAAPVGPAGPMAHGAGVSFPRPT